MILDTLQDAFFAALAAIGFAAISRPPKAAYFYCAVIAAAGHSLRFILMNPDICGMGIVSASFIASFLVGLSAVFLSPIARMPAETCFFPALLPMVPGIYAYKSFAGLAMCILKQGEESFNHYFYLFSSNGLICISVLICMVVGATIPVFAFQRISFRATR